MKFDDADSDDDPMERPITYGHMWVMQFEKDEDWTPPPPLQALHEDGQACHRAVVSRQ